MEKLRAAVREACANVTIDEDYELEKMQPGGFVFVDPACDEIYSE